MKNLYFKRSTGGYLLIKQNVLEENALEEISAFLQRHNYKSYYTRYWKDGNSIIYDVGSWSEFFELTDKNPPIKGTEEDFIDRKVE